MIVAGLDEPRVHHRTERTCRKSWYRRRALFTGLLVRFVGWHTAFAGPGVNPPAVLILTLLGRRPKIRAHRPVQERRTPQQSRPRTPDPSRCFRGDLGARPTQGLPPALADPSVPYAVP
jgi:hypothetical protein